MLNPILQFVREREKGVVQILGASGMGKTWLLRQVERRFARAKTRCLYCSAGQQHDLQAFVIRLQRQAFQRRIRNVPPQIPLQSLQHAHDAFGARKEFVKYLEAIVANNDIPRLVIAVDGLDSAEEMDWEQASILDVLPDTSALPSKCFLIVGMQHSGGRPCHPWVQDVLDAERPSELVLRLEPGLEGQTEFVRSIVRNRLRQGRAKAAADFGVEAIVKASQSSPLRASYLCSLMAFGRADLVSPDITQGELIKGYLKSVKGQLGDAYNAGFWRAVLLLSAAFEPLTSTQLDALGVEDEHLRYGLATADNLLFELRETRRRTAGSEGQFRFHLRHDWVAELLRRDHADEVRAVHADIVARARARCHDDWRALNPYDEFDRYLLRYAPQHALSSGAGQPLDMLGDVAKYALACYDAALGFWRERRTELAVPLWSNAARTLHWISSPLEHAAVHDVFSWLDLALLEEGRGRERRRFSAMRREIAEANVSRWPRETYLQELVHASEEGKEKEKLKLELLIAALPRLRRAGEAGGHTLEHVRFISERMPNASKLSRASYAKLAGLVAEVLGKVNAGAEPTLLDESASLLEELRTAEHVEARQILEPLLVHVARVCERTFAQQPNSDSWQRLCQITLDQLLRALEQWNDRAAAAELLRWTYRLVSEQFQHHRSSEWVLLGSDGLLRLGRALLEYGEHVAARDISLLSRDLINQRWRECREEQERADPAFDRLEYLRAIFEARRLAREADEALGQRTNASRSEREARLLRRREFEHLEEWEGFLETGATGWGHSIDGLRQELSTSQERDVVKEKLALTLVASTTADLKEYGYASVREKLDEAVRLCDELLADRSVQRVKLLRALAAGRRASAAEMHRTFNVLAVEPNQIFGDPRGDAKRRERVDPVQAQICQLWIEYVHLLGPVVDEELDGLNYLYDRALAYARAAEALREAERCAEAAEMHRKAIADCQRVIEQEAPGHPNLALQLAEKHYHHAWKDFSLHYDEFNSLAEHSAYAEMTAAEFLADQHLRLAQCCLEMKDADPCAARAACKASWEAMRSLKKLKGDYLQIKQSFINRFVLAILCAHLGEKDLAEQVRVETLDRLSARNRGGDIPKMREAWEDLNLELRGRLRRIVNRSNAAKRDVSLIREKLTQRG